MIRRLTLSLLAAGCLIATASAAPMPSQTAPEHAAVTSHASQLTTGRSAWHGHHWHHPLGHWHHRDWHPHHWHPHPWHPHLWHHWHHHH